MGINDTAVEGVSSAPQDGVRDRAAVSTQPSKEDAHPSPTGAPKSGDAAAIQRALSYPYDRPKDSFLFRDGKAHELAAQNFEGLHFVLAIGSNAAPEQLLRKYGRGVSIPVVAVEAHGLDVVYAAIMSNYGSIPATAVRSEGTVTCMHATLLTDGQLRRMHETEGGYYFCRVVGDGVRVTWDGGVVETVYCYVARSGALCNEEVLGIEEVAARDRVYTAVSQRAVQEVVRRAVGWEESVETFAGRNVGSKERRDEAMRGMSGTGVLDDCFEIVSDIGSVITSVE